MLKLQPKRLTTHHEIKIFSHADNYLFLGFNFQCRLIISNGVSSNSKMSQTVYFEACFPMKSSFDVHKAVYIHLVPYW